MNGRELVVLLACLACATSAILFVVHQVRGPGSAQRRRLDALLASLQDPALDAATRAEVVRTLARESRGSGIWLWEQLQQPRLWRMLWFAIGWFVLILGGAGLFVVRIIADSSDGLPVLAMLAAAGFAMVSMPMAWREVSRRAHADDAA